MTPIARLAIILSLVPVILTMECSSAEKAVSADGVPISFRVQGRGEPALVLVHGWCCNKDYWDAQAACFSGKFRVVTIDLAGHGESGSGRKNWNMGAFGEDVVAVADKLGLDSMVLIGHSLGGSVVLEAARRLLGRVIGIVGADTFKIIEPEFSREQVDEWLSRFRGDFAKTTRDHVRGMFPASADTVLVEKIVTQMSSIAPEVGLGALEASLGWMINDQTRALQQAGVPIRCINSDQFPTDSISARKYASSFEITFMKGVGHFVMNEDPETFNRLLAEVVNEFVQDEDSE